MADKRTTGLALALGLLAATLPACLQAEKTDHVAGPAGSACNTNYHRQGCYVTTGKPAMQERMACKNNKWTLLEICSPPLVCVERSDPTSPDTAMRYADCTTAISKGGADTFSSGKDAYGSDTTPAARCGDGACNGSENWYNCPMDCTCGDGKCTGSETVLNCPADCHVSKCGDGHCQASETKSSCPADCSLASLCGDGQCTGGETQSGCPADCTPLGVCVMSNCYDALQACLSAASCRGIMDCVAACGSSGGCANDCASGTPPGPDYYGSLGNCIKQNGCGQPVATCGDGACQPGETAKNCSQDCDANSWKAGCIVRSGLGAGCQGCACETCVCATDSFCCGTAWDNKCIQSCAACGSCP